MVTKTLPNAHVFPIAKIIERTWKIFKIKSYPPITRFDLAFVAMPRRYNIDRAKKELNYRPVIDRKNGFMQLN